MSWLEQHRSGVYHVAFRVGETRFKRSLGTKDKRKAEGMAGRIDENIALVERGRLTIPDGTDVVAFLLSDGKVNGQPEPPKSTTLKALFDDFLHNLRAGSIEDSTLYGMKIHIKHLKEHLGAHFRIQELQFDNLQDYVHHRGQDKGLRGRKLSATTIKKEMVTLKAIWTWAMRRGLVSRAFPNEGLRYPKTTERPAFQTWADIERRVQRGGLTPEQQADLWDCLFLTLPEVEAVLEHVRLNAAYPFLYPMILFAAHTGARRSEMMRSQIDDIDLVRKTAVIREKKRVPGKCTTRTVPLSPLLTDVLQDWLARHPGGSWTFSHTPDVLLARNGKRDFAGLTEGDAHDGFKRVLAGSKWSKLRGWHVFRHSFCSNAAAAGIDQRIINGWVGHQTEEMVRRYRHLIPNQQQEAIQLVFARRQQPLVADAG
jgi:integrase